MCIEIHITILFNILHNQAYSSVVHLYLLHLVRVLPWCHTFADAYVSCTVDVGWLVVFRVQRTELDSTKLNAFYIFDYYFFGYLLIYTATKLPGTPYSNTYLSHLWHCHTWHRYQSVWYTKQWKCWYMLLSCKLVIVIFPTIHNWNIKSGMFRCH